MKEIELKAKTRDTGKKASADYRRAGLVPGVYYLKGEENANLLCHPLDLRDIVYTQMTRIVDLQIEGDNKKRLCVLKDVRFDPVTDKMTHFDLLGVVEGQKLNVEIPFKLTGQSIGVRNGGKMQHVLHKVKVTCLPKDLVESIEVDITNLKLGQSVAIKDLSGLDELEFGISTDTVICHVARPRVGGADDLDEETPETAEATAETEE